MSAVAVIFTIIPPSAWPACFCIFPQYQTGDGRFDNSAANSSYVQLRQASQRNGNMDTGNRHGSGPDRTHMTVLVISGNWQSL